jgi:hypothetical protein
MYKNNVIDLSKRLKSKGKTPVGKKASQNGTNPNPNKTAKTKAPIVDMTERRQEIMKEDRRTVRRTILTGFIGAFVVVPQKGLLRVDLYDISENGVAFDMATEHGNFARGEEVAMRVYVSQGVYFPFVIKIQNVRELIGDGSHRHGADFLKETVNEDALYHFVRFIETVSVSLEKDLGDVMVSNLKK